MTLPRRALRNITYDGRRYHWVNPDGRDFEKRSTLPLTVQAVSGQGQVLIVDWGWMPTRQTLPLHRPAYVANAIREGLARGWNPGLPGPPVHLR